MFMTKEEIKNTVKWPANVKQPIDRDHQIKLMKTARERHLAHIQRLKEITNDVD